LSAIVNGEDAKGEASPRYNPRTPLLRTTLQMCECVHVAHIVHMRIVLLHPHLENEATNDCCCTCITVLIESKGYPTIVLAVPATQPLTTSIAAAFLSTTVEACGRNKQFEFCKFNKRVGTSHIDVQSGLIIQNQQGECGIIGLIASLTKALEFHKPT
jgi:hypothetical protein